MREDRQDIEELVDGQKFSLFSFNLLAWSFLATFADGFEISAIGFAAPHIIRDWGVPAQDLGLMLSASLIGNLVGLPIFGALGDRYGRRPAIIAGCFIFGLSTLAVLLATTVMHVTILRFITGIGMCGLLPNVIALNAEMAPRHNRGRLLILMFMGITMGSSSPGVVSYWFVDEFGWKFIFLMGGVISIAVSVALIFVLPESVKYLAGRPDRGVALLRLARKMRPDLRLSDDTRFGAVAISKSVKSGFMSLFTNGLAPITLVMWLVFIATLLANFFINSWMPALFEAKGLSPADAAYAATMYHFGATLGGLAICFLVDRYGFVIIAIFLAIATPALLAISPAGVPAILQSLLIGITGFSILGAQFGLNAAAGLIYPTSCRAQGVGMAFAVGRIGSISGPMIGAVMIGAGAPFWVLMTTIAAVTLAGTIGVVVLAFMAKKRLGGWSLDEGTAIQPV